VGEPVGWWVVSWQGRGALCLVGGTVAVGCVVCKYGKAGVGLRWPWDDRFWEDAGVHVSLSFSGGVLSTVPIA